MARGEGPAKAAKIRRANDTSDIRIQIAVNGENKDAVCAAIVTEVGLIVNKALGIK